MSDTLKKQLIPILPKLRRFALSLTKSVPEADDLVQEGCLRALSRAETWDSSQPLDRWMFRILRNLWISEIRKRGVRLGQGQIPADEANELVSQDTGEANVVHGELKSRVLALPEDLSTVLLLVSVEGYTYAEAADMLAIPVGTVMSRIHRARKELARQLTTLEGAAP